MTDITVCSLLLVLLVSSARLTALRSSRATVTLLTRTAALAVMPTITSSM